MTRRSASTNRAALAVAVLALLCAGVIGYRVYRTHRASQQAAVIDRQLDQLAAPARRRDPVSLRPGAR